MKNRILSLLILLTSLSAGPALAQGYGGYNSYGSSGADESLPIYIGVNVSIVNYSEEGLGGSHGAGITAGWRFDDMWSVEATIQDLGDTGPGGTFDVINYGVVGKAFWPLSSDTSGIYGKLGIVQHKIDMGRPLSTVTVTDGTNSYNVTDQLSFNTTAYGPALGVGYQFMDDNKSGFFAELMYYSFSETVERSATVTTPANTELSIGVEGDVEANIMAIHVGVIF